MTKPIGVRSVTLNATLFLALLAGAAQATPVVPALDRPAVSSALAARSVLQGGARVGSKLIAVGERGIVVLSDDLGKTWRQVQTPTSVGLTAVRFVDDKHGWITGHGGVVLASSDGGQTWRKQLDGHQAARLMLDAARASGDAHAQGEAERLVADGADKPLLDAHFFDTRHGLVVGAYNLAFETRDGGQSWFPISAKLDNPRALHLYGVSVRGNEIVIAGEQGLVLRSTDGGLSFARLTLPYKGSFFTVALPGTTDIVVAGLRGNVLRSRDGGMNWSTANNTVPVSITASAVDGRGQLWLANQAGMLLKLQDSPQGPLAALTSVKLPPLNGLLPLGTSSSDDRALALTMVGAVPVTLESTK